MATPLAQDKQRLWDLVRYYRRQFHEAGLITDNEYAELAQDHGAVVSLETWDKENYTGPDSWS